MIKRFYLAALSLLIASAAVLAPLPKASAFDQTMIMSDSVFDNTGTMDGPTIDAFLNKFPNTCIGSRAGIPWPDVTGYSPSNGFSYGPGLVTAGTVIAHASQVYGINPQVILSTLQKEQSLVTGSAGCYYNTPDPNNTFQCNLWGAGNIACTSACPYSGGCVSIAMGNNCPGNCQADTEGFSKQIIDAAWKLRFHEQRAKGNVNWNVQLSNYPNSGNVWDNSDDPPTHYSGRMVAGHFQLYSGGPYADYDGCNSGSPIDGQAICLVSAATAALYDYTPHISGNQNFVNIFQNTFGFGDPTTGQFTISHPDGTLIKSANPSYPKVYLTTQSGKAEFGTSGGVLLSNGYDPGKFRIATQNDVTAMYNTDTNQNLPPSPMFFRCGSLVKADNASTVYVMDGCSSNVKARSLVDQNNFNRLTYNFGSVITVPASEIQPLIDTPYDSSNLTHPNGSLVRPANSPTVYLLQPCSSGPACVNGQQAFNMTSIDYFISWGFNFNQVEIATDADLSILSAAGSNAITWFREGTLVRANNSPTVYIIDANDSNSSATAKRSFGNYYTFVNLGYNFNEVLVVPPSELSGVSDGAVVSPY